MDRSCGQLQLHLEVHKEDAADEGGPPNSLQSVSTESLASLSSGSKGQV